MDTKVIDKAGTFHVNPNEFAFVDPDPVAEKQIRYEQGVIYKVKEEPGSWLETQVYAGVIRRCDEDGTMEPVPVRPDPKVPVVVANASVPASQVDGTAQSPAPAPAPAPTQNKQPSK